jgi:hypothetical protein
MNVYPRHLRKLGYCRRGTREFFYRHDLDWSEFLRNGLPEQEFLATGDAMAIRLVKVARDEQKQQ